ncbi:hypothetical protein IGI04_042248 [Brassica rapa subsp. trilocularis]|uniref:Uncharacterized protein n=1 Tax=Brassica rapa subsp. trilocularis TaxID=1813537 RepID=A0ABQ7KNA1_BRACM|nr:hypothetical protein IGI04_042248 [Brassica rapa subsp. trilocularis]
MDMKHESIGAVKIQEENKWVWPRWVKTALGSCEIWSNQEGAKRKKGRLRRRSKAQIRRGRCWKRSILSGYQGSYGTMKMGRVEAQQILMGECSYSAYMGESVESSGVMRKLETKGADERVTKEEWDEFVKIRNPAGESLPIRLVELEEQLLLIMRGGMELNLVSKSKTKRIQVFMIKLRTMFGLVEKWMRFSLVEK